MADSDEEYDRRKGGRDKFKSERREYDNRSGGAARPDKRDYYDERPPTRTDYGSGRRGASGAPFRGERYHGGNQATHQGDAPPLKRARRADWEDGPTSAAYQRKNEKEDYPTQPAMKSFKQFLTEQDDNISEQDALQKYKEYKEDFVRHQLSDFFNTHKEEEWFKEKYHPDLCLERQRIANENVARRLRVFQDLLAANWFDNRPIVYENSDALVKFMDALVIKLEGGNNADLKMLDAVEDKVETKTAKNVEKHEKNELKKKKKNKHSESESSGSESSSSSSSSSSNFDSEDDDEVEEGQHRRKSRRSSGKDRNSSNKTAEKVNEDEIANEDSTLASVSGVNADNAAKVDSDVEIRAATPINEENEIKVQDDCDQKDTLEDVDGKNVIPDEDAPTPTEAEQPTENGGACHESGISVTTGSVNYVSDTLPSMMVVTSIAEILTPVSLQPLHKTNSIFLRNLHPDITRQEIEVLCRSYQGFMRLALQDPAAERKFFRRGWVTFAPDINIKEVCWNLNNIRLKDCDLGAIVNRELSQRVRPVGFAACHKPVMRADVKFAARIIQHLDHRQGLWQDSVNSSKEHSMAYSFVSNNPLMKNITDFLVEEGSYEDQLLDKNGKMDVDASTDEISIESDPELASVLDRLIFYLRAVHSVDYYAAVEYPNEDEMPHRCGIMHARGAAVPPEKPLTQREVDKYMRDFEVKVKHLLDHADFLSEENIKRLGSKDVERAVEDFLMANTQELAKDKWLCPLSGKKFKGPEFVRKHIFNKHNDRVEIEKRKVIFFNNYLRDPKRPQLPEHSGIANVTHNASGSGHRAPFGERVDQREGRTSGGGGYERGYSGGYDRGYNTGSNNYDYGGGYGNGSRHGSSGWYDYGGGRSSPTRGYGGSSGGGGYGSGGYGYDRGGSGYGGYGRRPYGDRGYGDTRRGYGGDRGGGMQREGRSYKIMRPDGRKVLTYTDLDAPTEEF